MASHATMEFDDTAYPEMADEEITTTRVCDERQNPTRIDAVHTTGGYTFVYTNTYDEGGHLVRVDQVYTWWDEDWGDETSATWTYTWEDDRLLSTAYDSEAYSSLETSTYDDRGNALSRTHTNTSDPDSESVYYWTYDAHDRLVGERTEIDGEFGRAQAWDWYDTVRHAREQRWYGEDDGIPTNITRYTCTDVWPWSCDGTSDGSYGEPPDGNPDVGLREAWTCLG